jgi:hypothetical protein
MENIKSINATYSALKSSAKKRGIKFTITKSDLHELDIPISCPVLGIPLRFEKGAATDNSVSYDRIDSTLGYEPGNLIIISMRANRLKSDATLNELRQISEFFEELENLENPTIV